MCKNAAARQFGIDRKTVAKMLKHAVSDQNYQGGHFWTPITPIWGSKLHTVSHPDTTSYRADIAYVEHARAAFDQAVNGGAS